MASMEARLVQNEVAVEKGLEVEITTQSLDAVRNGDTVSTNKKGQKPKAQGHVSRRAAPPRQVMGQCKRCGYLSSQEICKACVLLEGLNKNRPKNRIEVGVDEDGVDGNIGTVVTGLKEVQLEAI